MTAKKLLIPRSGEKAQSAEEWGRELASRVAAVMQAHPEVDPENVRHTLILRQLPPIERLRRSLLRGGA